MNGSDGEEKVNAMAFLAQFFSPEENITFTMVDRTEVKDIVKHHLVKNLCKWVQNGANFVLSDSQVEKMREWLKNQERLHDGCIEFNFCPCFLGTNIVVTNSLTKEQIDLTEHE